MLYEMHITISDGNRDPALIRDWIDFCDDIEVKPLYIELVGGGQSPQLMFAATLDTDDLSGLESDLWNEALTYDVLSAGFEILRKKLEVPLDQALYHAYPTYFESHVKTLLTPKEADKYIPIAADRAGMKASKNLFKQTDDEKEKWYLTDRWYVPSDWNDQLAEGEPYKHPMYEAADILNDSFKIVTDSLVTVRMEKEAVLFDTNPNLDKGWC